MVRLAPLTALVTLVVLSTATALRFDYDVRILNRKSGGWVNGHDGLSYAPIVVEEKSANAFGVWSVKQAPDNGPNYIVNKGSESPIITPLDEEQPLVTFGGRLPPSFVRLEDVDVSAYRIQDTRTELYWTRERNLIYLRDLNTSDDNQVWEFRPEGFDDEFAFWE
ncbi:hypothetical protein DFQ27_005985 [Actinomortierella ambigua]|uniref:Uncharacterized protein n=1 Tax=Actinomortierella ambigua TaxID=1343610 RepID=A0A9P6PX83_9FUNG|nr:hypothetical protein DFQ27_005985 [Actinomortierella ambigua]